MNDPDKTWKLLVEASHGAGRLSGGQVNDPPPGFVTRVAAVWHERCANSQNQLLLRWRRATLWGLSLAAVCILVVPELFPEPTVLLNPPELLPPF